MKSAHSQTALFYRAQNEIFVTWSQYKWQWYLPCVIKLPFFIKQKHFPIFNDWLHKSSHNWPPESTDPSNGWSTDPSTWANLPTICGIRWPRGSVDWLPPYRPNPPLPIDLSYNLMRDCIKPFCRVLHTLVGVLYFEPNFSHWSMTIHTHKHQFQGLFSIIGNSVHGCSRLLLQSFPADAPFPAHIQNPSQMYQMLDPIRYKSLVFGCWRMFWTSLPISKKKPHAKGQTFQMGNYKWGPTNCTLITEINTFICQIHIKGIRHGLAMDNLH